MKRIFNISCVFMLILCSVSIAGEFPENGPYKEYFDNGNLKSEMNFKNGTLHGIIRHYNEKGILTTEESFIDGKKNKLSTFYDDNGDFLDGVKTDEEEYRGGKIMSEDTYEMGKHIKGTSTVYNKSGVKISEMDFENGQPHGVAKRYYETGELKLMGTWKDASPHGIEKAYFKSGKLKSETEWIEGKIGTTKQYYENGNPKIEHIVNAGIPQSYRAFFENGILEYEEFYKDGHLSSSKEYEEDGSLKEENSYTEDAIKGFEK